VHLVSARGPDPERAQLDARVVQWMGEAPWSDDESRFEELALELFAFQYRRCEPFARFCKGRGATPHSVQSWRDIPPVPTGAFKEVALRSFPAEREAHAFRTSGTATRDRGELHLDTLAVYEASLLPSFRRHVLPDLASLGGRIPIHVLAPTPDEAPDSSLTHMFQCALRELGSPESAFHIRAGAMDFDSLRKVLHGAAGSDAPLALCGTAFAFVHLVDELAGRGDRIELSGRARVMETGGFKGRSRVLSHEALYAEIEARIGVPPERIVNQYGMTELGSQFYDSVLRFRAEPRRKLRPPWTRVRIVDPRTGAEARAGERGIITIVDLANTGSVLAVQTADLGRTIADGFEVLGREPGAEARGCSIAADEMLARATP
jgi:uncharacterized protein YndB with AHSA1/START domain